MKDVDADYYGFGYEDDGVIVPLEREAQVKALHLSLAEAGLDEQQIEDHIQAVFEADETDLDQPEVTDKTHDQIEFAGPKTFISYVPYVPSAQEIQKAILQKKKEELLRKYIRTEDDQPAEQES
jgi:hypothetical protein